MENMQKGMKRKIGLLVGVIAIIVALIITMVVVKVNKQKENFAKANPELAKAMEYDQVQEGEENVDGTDRHVKFDAFFLRDLNGDGYAESIRGTSKEIGDEDTLYMELNVLTAGYLKDAKITVNDGNFYFQTALPKDDQLKDNYIGNNVRTIEFNQLNNGTQKMLTGIVRSGDYSYSSRKNAAIGNNINNYSKVDSVTLTGTYVGEDGTETPITKTVNFNIDWYGTARATIYTSSSYNSHSDLDSRIDEENGTITLDFSVRTEETKDELILKDNHVEVTIPQLNGYDPISVEYTGSNATANYNSNTKVLTIDREAQVGEDGTVTSGLSDTNSYSVRVVYPLEAYQAIGEEAVTIKIPVSTYYEGYNNPSEEFDNPYKSNTATATLVANYKNPTGSVARFDVTVGKNLYSPSSRYVISKQKPLRIYNGVSDSETDDTYQVRWYAYTGTDGAASGIVMKETENGKAQVVDNFIKTDSSKDSMENVTTNIGIAFSEVDSILKEDGWIKVYDEDTGDLLVTFTKADWNKYTANNPYKYELPVKHIRVETSETNANSSFYVYNIKELDDDYITTNYTREAFDNLQYIQSTLVGYLGGTYINTDTYQAHYEAPYSIADIGISNNTISTQITEKNEKLTITARYDSSSNQIGWVDGSFVVKLPEEIIDAQINDVQINNSAVSITSYELVEQDGVKLIKINTKNNNDTPQTYSITVDVDITPDPRVATVSRNIELYATNEESSDYYYNASDIYDVNNNLNTEEKVNYDTTSISMVSPNSLLTNQVGSNYDDKGSQVVSPQIADIKPVYAVVDQDEEKEATIGVQVRNNYASTISEIQILGKIPFEGNTYVISGGDLGSTFTTKMTDTGIVVPDDLKQYATVYYSENENPDRDLNKEENGWKTAEEVTNWDNVKTFLIDLGDYVMPTGKEYVFNYTVKIPNGLEFNQVSFSHHGVYFSLDTDQGKYRTQTEPNRLGFRIAEKYNLELTKYQIGKDKLIPGATYSVTDEQTGESKTAVTTANGTLTINNLYAEKAYLIKEIKTPDSYELNSDVIRFIGHVDNEGNLTIEKTSGTTKGDIQVIKEEGQDYKVTVKVEDEVKASIKIHKTEKGNNSVVVPNVKYKLTGYGLSENGRVITTNANGEVTISGLSVNQEYTLQETKADGYYLAEPITFKIVNNDGNYSVQTTSGTIENQSTTEEDSIPTITLNFEDEKIPTYSLQIIKVKKTTDTTVSEDEATAQAGMEEGTDSSNAEVTYLEGAKFKLYKGTKEIGAYTTDGTGTVTIDNLYQYIEGKDEEATYTLKEVLAPEGYAKVKDITFKVDGTDGSLKLINTDGTQEDYTVEGNTVKLTIEDSPSFKLIKKDAETQQPITNVKFAIYNVENGETPATNSKGEIIGTKETINGKEYYTVQTDEKGELTADLTEGLYKAVEVQAPDQYDIEGQEYYFGIGASREAPEGMVATWGASFGGSSNDRINSVASTSDGGYIVGGSFGSNTIQVGNETLTNHSNGANDGLIIKYNSEGAVEWANSFGGSYYDYIESVTETSDGGYIAGGYFDSTSIQVENETLTRNGDYDGIIIKYNRSGDLEWVKKIGGSADDYIQSVASTSDGGVIVGGYFESTTIQVGNETLTNNTTSYPYTNDGLVIKYNSEGAVEWAKLIGGSGYDYIYSVASTSDGGAIVGGDFGSSTIQVGNETLTNYRNGYYDGLIIKYNSSGAVEWATSFGGSSNDRINSVASTSDGGVIVGGYFDSSTIQVENETLTNNGDNDGLVIKYNSSGAIEWAKSIGESGYDYIRSVASTSDGGAIVGGDFSGTIQVGNETLTSSGGLIIKYNSSGVVEWAKNIGESNDGINSVVATSDGGAIAGGYFRSSTIQVGNETLTNKGQEDGLIIKYEMQELPNPVVTNAKSFGESGDDQIKSIAPTSDGGYIAGGYFKSSTIQLEGKNGEITLRNNGSTSYYDAVIIKYDKNKQIEWATSIGGSDNDYINSVAETSNGGYIVGGYFESSTIRVENKTLTNNGSQDGVIIKYSAEGEVEWAKNIGGSRDDEITSVAGTSDGGAIVGGDFDSSTIQVGNETLTNNGYETYSDGLIIKYSSSGEVEWTKSFGGSYSDKINSVASTSDGGAIVGGDFSGTIQVGNETLTNNGGGDGLIIKYNNEGDVEWANNIGGIYSDHIESVAPTSDGGYIVGGYFASRTIQIGNETLTNNRSQDGLIIKYSAEGEVEWADSYGGSSSDYIYSVASTSDGGYIAGGYFNSSVIQVGNETLTSKGFYDCLIIKYSAEGVVEWAKSIGGSSSDYIYSVASTSDGGYIAGGYFSGSTIDADGHTLESQGSYDGMILEVVNQVGVPEVQELTVENSRKEFKITTDVNEIDGVKGGNISGEGMNPYETVKYGDSSTKEIVMTPDENYEIIGITVNGEEWSFEEAEDGTYTMPAFENMTEDKHVEVTYSLKDNKIIINKVDSEDNNKKLPGATFKLDQIDERTNPENDEIIGDIVANGVTYNFVDNGEGGYESNNQGQNSTTANSYIPIDLTNYTGKYNLVVNANVSSQTSDYGYATVTSNTTAPLYSSSTGRFIYISGTAEEDTTPTDYTTVLQGGQMYYLHLGYYKNASTSSGDDKFTVNSVKVTLNDSELYHSEEITTNSEGQAITQIPFGKYQITEVTAPEGYELNTEPTIVEFRADGNHEFTIENKQLGKVIVHHYLKTNDGEYTTTPVAEDELQEGKDGDSYTTSPKLDLEKYELEKDEDGNYVIPKNATGTYTPGIIEVIYYYEEKDIPLTVHHYIDGTTTPVPLKDGGVAQDVTDSGKEGESYTTNAIEDSKLSDDYELVETPSNANGTYSGDGVVVTYYYKKVTRQVVINKYDEDGKTPLEGVKFTIASKETPQTIIGTFTTDSKGQIKVTLEAGEYIATETEVPEGYQIPENNTTEFSVTKGQDQVTLDITNTKIKGTVITHHYIMNSDGTTTETKVPNKDGGVVEDVVQTGDVGDIYATKQADNVSENYEYVSTVGETSGTIQNGTIEVIYYYKLKPTNVLVHHYIMNTEGTTTETKVPNKNGGVVEDELIDGQVNDQYTTNPSTDIANNYEVVTEKLPTNANGNMTLEQIVVTYYYKLKTPTVTNTIEKTGTERITAPDQEVNYTINYTANVTDYIGNAEVTIVDTLPYTIDISKANDLDGGSYNETDRTITWTENVSDLDSYNNKGTVNITKNIKVFYVGLDMNQEKITNNVKGSIKLQTPETTSEETKDDFDSTIYKSIISAEKMVDKTEAQEGEKVTYTVRIKNDGNLAKTVTLADTLPECLTFDTSTQIKVGSTGTVYTEQNLKNGIQVEVPEYSTVDVVFAGIVNTLPEGTYSKELKNKATLDNEPTNEVTTTVTKPNITAHKESDPVSGTKVTEGDAITYRIRVRNDGTRAGTVLVKDKVPEGTTFVEDSVRIGELQDLTKTAEDLENGISVTLGINEEKVVEFQVRVNKLADGTTIKNTAYINKDTDNPGNPGDEPGENPEDEKVPEEPEHTYVEPKEEQSISKTGTATIDSLDDEITYNINYTAHITDYEGNAKIVLVDQLPYEIDTTKTNILEDLDGGTYDAASKTITWEQPVENIQMTEGREVTINKQIKVVYTGISQDTLSIKNNIKAHIEYETPDRTSEEVTANWPTTTGFIVNIPVSKIWDDSDNKLGQRPTRVVFKLTGSDGSERTLEIAKPGTANTTTTQDNDNPNKWNDMFVDLPKYDSSNNEIVYTLTEEEKNEGDLKYYESSVDSESNTVTNTNKYGKVTVHHYVMNPDGSTTETRVPDKEGNEVQDEIIEGKEGDPYETEPADNVNEKYELVQEKLPEKPDGTIEKYDEEKPQEVIYYYRLKPAKVIIHYLEKDSDDNDANNLVLSDNEQIDGHVDDPYNTDEGHKKDTITKDGKTYTLVSNSGNTQGTMTVADTNVTYYYLQNTKATVRYVEGNPKTGEIVKDLETPRTEEGLVGDKFVTNSKEFTGYRLIQSPNPTTIKMTKEEQTLIYWYEPVYTGLIENHIDDKTGKVLYTKEHQVQVGQNYNIPPKNFEGYDRVTAKDPNNASGTMGEELVTVNYYYIKKAVLEVNYIDKETGEPLTDQIVDDTKHEGDPYTTEQKTFEDFDLVEVPSNKDGTLTVETDENGNITNNKTVVTYYYVRKAVVEEHHIDIVTGEELAEPTIYNGHVGDEYTTSSKEFLSYELVTEDKDGNNMLPTNAQGKMTEEKQVVTYYYYQPAKVIVHYVDRTTGKELEETNPETGELQSSQVIIEGQNQDDYTTTPKDFEYYKLVESPEEPNGKMKVEITKDENGKDVVNNTIDVYYYYEPKPFNIGVEKDISAIIVNGNRRNATNGKLEKVDIYRKSTENTSVQVEYKIKVMNTGEVEGRAIIEDKLPEGMTLANNDGTWEENGGVLRKVIPEIGAGETKEYTVLLNWKTSGNNMGNKVNEVALTETDNVPGFKDGNDKDNKDNATVSISVETGEFPLGLLVALVALVGLESVTLRYAVVLTKRQKKNNKK